MKIRHLIISAALIGAVTTNAFAVDLVDVYKQAFFNDPQFKAANAQWLADREALPLARAALLPQLSGSAYVARTRNESEGYLSSQDHTQSMYKRFFNNTSGYQLTLTQSLFNFGSWATVWGAQATAKKAEVTFLAAVEDLLYRTANAYFAVLLSEEVERAAKSNKEAIARTLDQTKHKYDVGLIAITDLENTRASYDSAVADEISAQNDLADKIEQLNEITNTKYLYLSPLKSDIPLVSPKPADMERWVKAAEKQNYTLAAYRYATIVARETIKVKNAGHLPTISAIGSYGYDYNNNATGARDFSRNKVTSGELSLNVPLFQGGTVLAQAKQANYQYQQAVATQEQNHRSVVSKTRQAYLGVLAGISKLQADKQALTSTQSQLRATEAGYSAGTRTMVEVLQAQTAVYTSQKNFAQDEYTYITQILALKQLAGVLDAADISEINTWLEPATNSAPKATDNDTTADKKEQDQNKSATKIAKDKNNEQKPTDKAQKEPSIASKTAPSTAATNAPATTTAQATTTQTPAVTTVTTQKLTPQAATVTTPTTTATQVPAPATSAVTPTQASAPIAPAAPVAPNTPTPAQAAAPKTL